VIAIVFSGIISVTLTPMLCARFLKDEHKEKHNAFYNSAKPPSIVSRMPMIATLHWAMAHKRTILAIFFASLRPVWRCSWSCRKTFCRPTISASLDQPAGQ